MKIKFRSKCFAGLAIKQKDMYRDLPSVAKKKLYCALTKPHIDY